MVATRVIRRLRDLDDVDTSTDPGLGASPVDDGSGVYPLTRVATTDDIDGILTNVAAVEYHDLGTRNEPPLLGGWQNYGDGFAPARYRWNANNVVHIQGLIWRADPLTEQTPIAQLPFGPTGGLIFECASAQSVSRVDIYPDGTILWFEHLVGDQAHTYLSLSGIDFSVAPPHPTQEPW